MAIIKKDSAILLRDGKVATETNCCCDCPPGKQCGPKCCKSEETCCEGVDKQNCCDASETCCDGSCCSQSQTCCDGSCCDTVCCNGVCCPPGQVCCGGVCCDSAKCCNGQCCPPNESCRYGQCSPCNCPEWQECCGSTDGDPDVCCDYGYCCGDACCDSAIGEVCCTKYDENFEVVSQECCVSQKCCAGVCCKQNEQCINGVCRETCGDCVTYKVGPVPEFPYNPCNPVIVDSKTIDIPPGCPFPVWVTIQGNIDDEIAIDGEDITPGPGPGLSACNGARFITHGFLCANNSFEISLKDHFGVNWFADLQICFFSEPPPP